MKIITLLFFILGLAVAADNKGASDFFGKYVHANNSPALLQKTGDTGLIIDGEKFVVIRATETLTSSILDQRIEKGSITLYGSKSIVLLMKNDNGTYSALFMPPLGKYAIGDEENKKNMSFQYGMRMGMEGPSAIFIKKKLDSKK